MKRIIFLSLLFFSLPCFAAGPIFRHKEREKQLEFENAYQDIRSIPRISSSTLPSGSTQYIQNSNATQSTNIHLTSATADSFTATSGTFSVVNVSSTISAGYVDAAAGSVSAPSITFQADPDTGFRSLGGGIIGVIENGVEIGYLGGSSTFQVPDGLVGTPGVRFTNDTNTGIYRSGADRISISLGGNQAVEFFSSGIVDGTPAIPAYLSGGGGNAQSAFELITQSTTGVKTTASLILTKDYTAYLCLVYGDDNAGNDFSDIIHTGYYSAGAALAVISARNSRGTPAARTYSQPTDGQTKVSMASGTYDIRTSCIGIASR